MSYKIVYSIKTIVHDFVYENISLLKDSSFEKAAKRKKKRKLENVKF